MVGADWLKSNYDALMTHHTTENMFFNINRDIHAPYNHIVVFWTINDIPPLIS